MPLAARTCIEGRLEVVQAALAFARCYVHGGQPVAAAAPAAALPVSMPLAADAQPQAALVAAGGPETSIIDGGGCSVQQMERGEPAPGRFPAACLVSSGVRALREVGTHTHVLFWREVLVVTRNPVDVAGRMLLFVWIGMFANMIVYSADVRLCHACVDWAACKQGCLSHLCAHMCGACSGPSIQFFIVPAS